MKNVIDFLLKLEKNNDREWFNANKKEFLAMQAEFNEFGEKLIEGIASFDDTVRGLTVKDCTYRIYRDTRFSANKLPYKTHMGFYICKGGKKSGNAGYYFHVEPTQEDYIGSSLISSGLYMPEKNVLQSIREDIAYNSEEFMSVLSKATGKGFELDTHSALKRVPIGFPADNPHVEYLKLKDMYVQKRLDNDYLLAPDLLERTVENFKATKDFINHLNRAVDYAREEMK